MPPESPSALIKAGYPRIPVTTDKKAYFQLVRPYTIIVPFFAILLGAWGAMLYADLDLSSPQYWITGILAALSLSILQAAGQVLNQSLDDPELDKINGKGYRPITSGQISRADATIFGVGLTAIAFICALMVSVINGPESLHFFAGILLIFGIVIIYNTPRFYVKRYFLINTVILAIARGLLPFMAIWHLYTPIDKVSIFLSLVFFLHVLAWQNTKDIPDMEGDREYGIRTLPVVWGVGYTIIFIFSISVYQLILSCHLAVIHPPLGLMMIPPILSICVAVPKTLKPMRNMENTFGWVWFYLCLAIMYFLLPMSQQILG